MNRQNEIMPIESACDGRVGARTDLGGGSSPAAAVADVLGVLTSAAVTGVLGLAAA